MANRLPTMASMMIAAAGAIVLSASSVHAVVAGPARAATVAAPHVEIARNSGLGGGARGRGKGSDSLGNFDPYGKDDPYTTDPYSGQREKPRKVSPYNFFGKKIEPKGKDDRDDNERADRDRDRDDRENPDREYNERPRDRTRQGDL